MAKKTRKRGKAEENGQSSAIETSYPLRLEWRTPSELAENPRNWRQHSSEQAGTLQGVIGQVGWAGAALFNENTGRLIDGHLRKKIDASLLVDGKIPVLVGSWDESQEALILASFDPIGAMATANAEALSALLAEVETQDAAVRAMLDGLAEGIGQFNPDGTDMPDLSSGDRAPFQQMTFTLHDDQAEVVKSAIEAAKKAGPFVDSQNENSNGNALARIAEAYCGAG